MTDRPIICSAPMVRALVEGRKTQTRRIAKVKLRDGVNPHFSRLRAYPEGGGWRIYGSEAASDRFTVPYTVGNRLWVREAFSGPHEYDVEKWPPGAWFTNDPIWYWADGNPTDGDWTRPRPSIHLPRWASRLTLLVTDVRVQRLQDISEKDAVAEGVGSIPLADVPRQACWSNRADFAQIWNSLHGPDAWTANPFVCAITFTTINANIDTLEADRPALPSQGRE